MNKLTSSVFIISLVLTPLLCAQEKNRSVDVTQFDIANVRLGMTKDEAIKAISSKLGVTKANMREDTLGKNAITGKKEPTYVIVERNNDTYSIYFTPDVNSSSGHQMVVDRIVYSLPWSTENVKLFKKAALEKYGQPSDGTIGMSWSWCKNPHDNRGIGCFGQEAVLELSGTKLELSDMKYHNNLMKYFDKKKTTTPSF